MWESTCTSLELELGYSEHRAPSQALTECLLAAVLSVRPIPLMPLLLLSHGPSHSPSSSDDHRNVTVTCDCSTLHQVHNITGIFQWKRHFFPAAVSGLFGVLFSSDFFDSAV